MHYTQIIPPDRIKQWVRFFWVFEGAGDAAHVLNPLADGCPGIILQHPSDGRFHDAERHVVPEILLYGQTINCSPLYLSGKFNTFGVCFNPSSLNSLFRINASELTDSCTDFTLMVDDLREPLANSASPVEKADIFSERMWKIIKKRVPVSDPSTDFAVRRIVESRGNVEMRSLQKELKLSERGLQRKFNQHVGISPKMFSRVCQFQASLTQLRKSDFQNLSDIAFDNGYSDQSHFIRSFREFAGFSPLQFQKSKRLLTPNFTIS